MQRHPRPVRRLVLVVLGAWLAAAPAARAEPPAAPGAGFVENGGQFPPEVRFLLADGEARWIVLDDALVLQARDGVPASGRVRGTNVVLRVPAPAGTRAEGHLPQAARINVLREGVQTTGLRRFDAIAWRAPDGRVLAAVARGTEGLSWTSAGSGAPLVEGAGTPRLAAGCLEWPVPGGALQMRPAGGATSTWPAAPTSAIGQGINVRWSSFLGGSSHDEGLGIGLWASGGVQHTIVCGQSYSLDFDQPMPAGGYDITGNGNMDAFVASLSANGATIDWATFVGGAMDDVALDLAIGGSGAIHVVGHTFSDGASGAAFPVTTSIVQDPGFGGPSEAFVLVLDATGSALVWSAVLGGSGEELGFGIGIDPAGRTCVTGLTISPDFPRVGAVFPNDKLNGTGSTSESDGFLSVLSWQSPTLSLAFSSFITGDRSDAGVDLAIDAQGAMHVVGNTNSLVIGAIPSASVTGFDPWGNAAEDGGFVVSYPFGGGAVFHSTFLEGTADDTANAVVVDGDGHLLVTGYSMSSDFPTTAGAYDTTANGDADAYVVRLDPQLAGSASLLYGSLYGGSEFDIGWDLAVTADDRVHLVGHAESADLPMNARSWDTTLNGSRDAFVATIDLAATPASALVHATYVGGYFIEWANAIAFDAVAERGMITGITFSSDFPVTAIAADPVYSYHGDAFVTGILLP
jgi:hypothetical protein